MISREEQQLRDQKFLQGIKAQAQADRDLVGDWQSGLTPAQAAEKNNVSIEAVSRAIDDYMTSSAVFDTEDF
jgi:hypothetical protein